MTECKVPHDFARPRRHDRFVLAELQSVVDRAVNVFGIGKANAVATRALADRETGCRLRAIVARPGIDRLEQDSMRRKYVRVSQSCAWSVLRTPHPAPS